MRVVEILRQPSAVERSGLVAFVDEVTSLLGERPLSDHLWLDLNAGGSEGFHGVRIADATATLAYAQISVANDSSTLEIVVRPGLGDERAVHDDAFESVVDSFRRAGGGTLSWWVDDAGDADQALAARHGLAPTRGLYEMRRRLPTDRRSAVATRSFIPGADDDAWLDVNNRAFAEHGEQGGWTRDTLRLRTAEGWFDPEGFRIHDREGTLAAFCWTKLHHELDPVIGEIYVIAVDPRYHGLGLGRELTLAGLDSIADRGITEANLYVDAHNTAAVGLYERLGFTIHRTRRAFTGTPHTPAG